MRSSSSKGWWVLGAMAAYVAGCGGSSVKRGTPDDTQGRGGTAGGSGPSGTAGVKAGRGGSGAQGGATMGAGGSTARGGTAGSSGTAGAPGPDPTCDCTVHDRDFSCEQDTVRVPSSFADPTKCEVLDSRVKRELCYDGSTRYTFVVGEENDYRLDVDRDGNATYFSGSGYVSTSCGLDPSDYDYGSFTMGAPSSSLCGEACALCEDYDDLPACSRCERDPNDSQTVLETLDEYCSHDSCPATVAEAREHVASLCDSAGTGRIRTGCGTVTVYQEVGWSMIQYSFDQQTGALRGVHNRNDGTFGACAASVSRAGDPLEPCDDTQTCTLCAAETGEGGVGNVAGAAGAAGAAGDSNGEGTPCPP